MDPYEACWCRSGRKWKWCHKNRERQPPVNFGNQIAATRAEFTKGYCSHPRAGPGTCSRRIIRAHTVQRRGGLAAIAENGHVISAKAAFEGLFKNNGEIVPREIGVRSASTFMGFCSHHDTEMFRPVEAGTVSLTPEVCFLLSFRALAYEYFTKQTSLRILDIAREADRSKPFEAQCAIQRHIYATETGVRRALAELERWKDDYDATFLEKRFDAFQFYGVAFSQVLPIVGCGAFQPEFDFGGRSLQRLSHGVAPHEHVTCNLTVLNGSSLVVLGWTEGSGGPAADFVRSFANVSAAEKAEAAIRLAFEHLENIYMTPSWWHGLPKSGRAAAVNRMRSGLGTAGVKRRSGCLCPDGHCYAAVAEVVQEIAG